MTVCIAAIARGDTGSRIVLCCDSRLDQGWQGSTLYNQKLKIVGTGWAAMLSGRWQPAQEFIRVIGAYFRGNMATPSDAMAAAKAAAEEYHASPFFSGQEGEREEVLVAGFIGGDPIILHLASNGFVETQPYCAIGEGSNIVTVMMNQRNCSPTNAVEQVAYIVYEAKRCSERVGSVGKDTTLAIQYPTDSRASPKSVTMDMFSRVGLVHLTNMRDRYWLRHLPLVPKRFPKKCFVNPKAG